MAEEIELKLTLPPRAVKALLAHPLLQDVEAKRQRLHNAYYDTPDLALKACQIALRHRQDGKRLLQTVKWGDSVSRGLARRGEWEGPTEPGDFDFSGIDDKRLRHRLESSRSHLRPVFTTDFSRVIWQLRATSDSLIELALDRGTIKSRGRQARINEVELELKEGEASALFELAHQLQQTLPLHPAVASKAERGYRLWLDQLSPPAKAKPGGARADLSPPHAFRCVALACLSHLQSNESGVLAGSADAEYIHQMRVALRRLRSALKLFGPVLPPGFVERWDPPWREQGKLLGQARNWDVFYSQTLPPLTTAFPAHPESRRLTKAGKHQCVACRKAVRSAISAEPYSHLMIDFTETLYAPPFLADKETPPGKGKNKLRDFAVHRLARLAKRAASLAKRVQELDAAQRHRMRIAFKKLRYALEFSAPLLPARRLKPYRKELEKLQDALGRLNDLAVAQRLIARVPDVKADGVAAAWLAARNDLLLHALPEQVDRFIDIKAPWR